MPSDTALLISAWRTPRYLRRTLASWAKVHGAADLRSVTIALGRSEREDDQREVIAAMEPVGCGVTIRPDSPAATASPGMHRALGEAIGAAFDADPGLEFLVCGEEDIVVGDDVLALLDWERQLRIDHPRILVCEAHSALGQGWHPVGAKDDPDADPAVVRLVSTFHPWVFATWRDRWKEVIEPEWDWECNSGPRADQHGYDWQLNRIIQRDGYVAAAPDASRSQNIGRYEGVYANPANFGLTQSLNFREHREAIEYRLEVS